MTAREYRLKIGANSKTTVLAARKPYTVVLVWYGVRDAIGVAKCNPRDQWNPDLGFTIAKSRAIAELAERIIAENGFCGGETK